MLRFVDVTKAHLSAKCGEEEWVELPDEFRNFGEIRQVAEVAVRDAKGGVGMGGR